MNSSTRSIAVIRARLPYVDRRALSQAWFSALGLAEREAPRTARRATAALATAPGPQSASSCGVEALRSAFAPGLAACESVSVRRPARRPEAFGPDMATSRAVARGRSGAANAPRELRYPPVHASFRLEVDGGRVRVILRREGAVLHVVALCSPKHVPLVRQALARAAAHLRERGEALRGEVRALATSDGAA